MLDCSNFTILDIQWLAEWSSNILSYIRVSAHWYKVFFFIKGFGAKCTQFYLYSKKDWLCFFFQSFDYINLWLCTYALILNALQVTKWCSFMHSQRSRVYATDAYILLLHLDFNFSSTYRSVAMRHNKHMWYAFTERIGGVYYLLFKQNKATRRKRTMDHELFTLNIK